jgi:hypothetical protein
VIWQFINGLFFLRPCGAHPATFLVTMFVLLTSIASELILMRCEL